MSQEITLTLAAGAAAMNKTSGKFMSVKACSLPLLAAFNGGPEQTISAGMVIDRSDAEITYVNLRNSQSVAVTITFYIDANPVNYAPANNAVSTADTFALGNLGVGIGGAANSAFAGSPADVGGYLTIGATALAIPANGYRRQQITFSVAAGQAFPLAILDPNGNAFMLLGSGDKIVLMTSTALSVKGIGGSVSVSIGQIFYSSNG